jgi:hypothetical protein
MKLVKVKDLFNVKYGINLDLNKLEEVPMDNPNAIPYVARSEKNNGVTAYVERLNGQFLSQVAVAVLCPAFYRNVRIIREEIYFIYSQNQKCQNRFYCTIVLHC